ncbi:hypothetical protein SAMN05421676_103128 [Salinibacillus kushneri]|uniref:Uncharacterized protein n=1 Tax=Salinibacillus kushneri TaxID=237682 RepID=A0A1I0CEG4_9BACI|nr:hypothetical protein [Salinibacillus kushneri]SET17494.1 hypothetical protein SAMN05421676_103128 [Salinibacillus kushneri]
MSRWQIRRKRKNRKRLLGAFLLIVFFSSSMNMVFADQNIQSLLTNWFDQKKTAAIDEIEEAVDAEQQEQTQRLQKELQSEIEQLDKKLNDFTNQEKEKRVQAIQEHADELIANMNLDETEKREFVRAELKQIVQEAKNKMDNVRTELKAVEEAGQVYQPESEEK